MTGMTSIIHNLLDLFNQIRKRLRSGRIPDMTHRAREIFMQLVREFDHREANAKTLTDGLAWRSNIFVIMKLGKVAKQIAKNEKKLLTTA